jgi:hypothetical protein
MEKVNKVFLEESCTLLAAAKSPDEFDMSVGAILKKAPSQIGRTILVSKSWRTAPRAQRPYGYFWMPIQSIKIVVNLDGLESLIDKDGHQWEIYREAR